MVAARSTTSIPRNRRVRSVGELAENQFRAGLCASERAVKERLNQAESDNLMPHDLINAKPISARLRSSSAPATVAVHGSDQPLSEITQSAAFQRSVRGLTRERAGF